MRRLADRRLSKRVLGSMSAYSKLVMDDNPLAYYRLGDSTGPTVADEVSGQDGDVFGSIVFGRTGAIANDDNTAVAATTNVNDYLELPVVLDYQTNGGLAVELWLKEIQNDILMRDMTSGAGNIFWWDNGGQLRVRATGGDFDTGYPTSIFRGSVWVYYVIEYDHADTALKIYVNGEPVFTESITRSGSTTSAFRLFRNGTAGGSHAGGAVDELAFYDHPLGLARVEQHYAVGIG